MVLQCLFAYFYLVDITASVIWIILIIAWCARAHAACVCMCVCVFVGSCLATKVFIGNLPAMGREWVIIK